jgi:hypothetical protein
VSSVDRVFGYYGFSSPYNDQYDTARNRRSISKRNIWCAVSTLNWVTFRSVPRIIVTDRLASYCAAARDVISDVAHHRARRLNNRVENSHQPTRERERAMRRFKSMRHAQRFLAEHAWISNHFRPGRHEASSYHQIMMPEVDNVTTSACAEQSLGTIKNLACRRGESPRVGAPSAKAMSRNTSLD